MKRDELEPEERRRYHAAMVRLFAYMQERGIQRAWLARRLGVTRATVWHYEHRGMEMPLYRFEVACHALDVSPEKFGWRSMARRAKRAS